METTNVCQVDGDDRTSLIVFALLKMNLESRKLYIRIPFLTLTERLCVRFLLFSHQLVKVEVCNWPTAGVKCFLLWYF